LRNPEKDMPLLDKHASRFITMADRVIKKGFQYNETNHYEFMLISFLMKQREHARSICILIESGQYLDSTLIARVMLEGLCTLLWATGDREQRPLQWRAYALIADWELMQKKRTAGESIDPEYERELHNRLKKYGAMYLTKKARREGLDNLDRPYQKNWLLNQNGAHIPRSTVFEEVRGTELYSLYEEMSQWVHWTIKGFGETINKSGNCFSFNPNAYQRAAQSYTIMIQALIQTLELVLDQFSLETEPSLNELRDNYLQELDLEI
jgi:Family of unknown function (DUF5677)